MAEHSMNMALMIGVNNRAWVPCILAGAGSDALRWRFESYRYSNVDDQDNSPFFALPLPTSRGGFALYVDAARLDIEDADGDDYVDSIGVVKISQAGQSSIYTNATTRNSPGGYDYPFTANNCSAYRQVLFYMDVVVTTAMQLNLATYLRCYYE